MKKPLPTTIRQYRHITVQVYIIILCNYTVDFKNKKMLKYDRPTIKSTKLVVLSSQVKVSLSNQRN